MKDPAIKVGHARENWHPRRSLVSIGVATTFLFGIARAWAADDSGCKIVLDAIAKLGQTANHQYNTVTDTSTGGIREGELICLGDVIYVKVQDRWTLGPITPKEMAQQQQENIRSAKVYYCRHDRDEKVDGEMAAVYKAHSENEDGIEEALIWISKTRGLILRESVESKASQTKMSARFVYSNIKAPELQ